MKVMLVRLLALSCVLVAFAYAAQFLSSPSPAPVWAPISLALGANGIIITLMAIGAVRRDTMPRSLAWTFAGLFILCAGAFVFALVLPAREGAGGPLLLGLPLRTAVLLYGVGVVPIAVLPFAYALTFESSTLSEHDLEAVRAARSRMQR
ncbi:MAG: hypothetical protein ABIY52_07275 [Gemmatimonadaceae bacterium]